MKNRTRPPFGIPVFQYFAATLLPAGILLGLGLSYIKTLNTDISFSKSELGILPALQPLYQDILNLQKIRGLQYLASTTKDASLQSEIDSLQQAFNHSHEPIYSTYPETEKKHREIHAKTKLAFAIARLGQASPDEIFDNYSSLIFDHYLLLQHIAKKSKLLLDSDLDIFTLVEISVIRIPAITEVIGQLRGRSSVWFYNRTIEQHRTQLGYMFESGRKELKLLQAIISSLSKYKEIEGRLNTDIINDALSDYFLQFYSTLKLSPSKQKSKFLFMKGNQVLESINLLNRQVIDTLEHRLKERIKKQNNKQIIAMFSILLAIFSMVYFISRFYKNNCELFAAERRTKEELALSEKQQRAIVDTMADGLIIINQFGIIQKFNLAAEKMFGYAASEITGKNIKLLMPESFRSEHDNHLLNYRKKPPRNNVFKFRELEGLHKEGFTFPIELSVAEIDLGGNIQFSGIIRDISERKYIDRMKDEFISSVSHELRTPLTSIQGALGLIRGGVVGKLPEQAMDMFNIAINNSEHLLQLINDILDIQKISSGTMMFDFQDMEIMPFLQTVIRNNAAYGAQYGVKFIIRQALPNAWVRADRNRLQQVMNNLLSNAAKFSGESETVEINVKRTKQGIRVSVSDQGCGIKEEFKDRVFERFSQSDASLGQREKGSGLGLSIAKMIIEKHMGTIGFNSEEGIGSTFYFELPELENKQKNE